MIYSLTFNFFLPLVFVGSKGEPGAVKRLTTCPAPRGPTGARGAPGPVGDIGEYGPNGVGGLKGTTQYDSRVFIFIRS